MSSLTCEEVGGHLALALDVDLAATLEVIVLLQGEVHVFCHLFQRIERVCKYSQEPEPSIREDQLSLKL